MELKITRGFPGSGKSTWAREWVGADVDNRFELNRDNFRDCLGVGAQNNVETLISRMVDEALVSYARMGVNVVISDTNLRTRNLRVLVRRGIELGFDVQIVDFVVPFDELLRRNEVRDKPVPESKLRDWWARFPYTQWVDGEAIVEQEINRFAENAVVPVEVDESLPKAVVFDVDGTLARMKDRSPYDFARVSEDDVNENIADLARMYSERGVKVIVFSGREDSCRADTEAWLSANNVPYDELYMRASGDKRKDSIVKREMIDNYLVPHYYPLAWFDDRQQVVDMVRASFANVSTMCLQVAPGDF